MGSPRLRRRLGCVVRDCCTWRHSAPLDFLVGQLVRHVGLRLRFRLRLLSTKSRIITESKARTSSCFFFFSSAAASCNNICDYILLRVRRAAAPL